MASNCSGDEVGNVQEMSEGKDDEMDGETCSECGAKIATLMAVSFQGVRVVLMIF